MDTTSYIKTINEYKKSIDTQILQIRADRLFAFLINEREMKTIEWLMSKILDIKISEVEGKIIVKNSRIPIRNKKERLKNLDLLLEYNSEKYVIELNNRFDGSYIRNIVYALSVIVNSYKLKDKKDNYYHKPYKVNLINLNWHNPSSKVKLIPGILVNEVPYSEYKDDYIFKISNINLDYYDKLSYNNVTNKKSFINF